MTKKVPFKKPIAASLSKIIDERGISVGIKWFQRIKESTSIYDSPIEEEMNTLGYQFFQLGKFKDAIQIFKLCVDAFSKSSKTNDSCGEAYLVNGNK